MLVKLYVQAGIMIHFSAINATSFSHLSYKNRVLIFAIACSVADIRMLLVLTCAVSLSVFIGVSERQETETNIRQLKEKKKNDKDLENYRKWIQKSRNDFLCYCTFSIVFFCFAVEVDLPSESGSIRRRKCNTH